MLLCFFWLASSLYAAEQHQYVSLNCFFGLEKSLSAPVAVLVQHWPHFTSSGVCASSKCPSILPHWAPPPDSNAPNIQKIYRNVFSQVDKDLLLLAPFYASSVISTLGAAFYMRRAFTAAAPCTSRFIDPFIVATCSVSCIYANLKAWAILQKRQAIAQRYPHEVPPELWTVLTPLLMEKGDRQPNRQEYRLERQKNAMDLAQLQLFTYESSRNANYTYVPAIWAPRLVGSPLPQQ